MNKDTVISLQTMAIMLLSGVFGILLAGEHKLNKQLIKENDSLWSEVLSKTVDAIKAQEESKTLKAELEAKSEELKAFFDPAILTPSEKKKKK